jgi:hypothetical protein
MTHFICNAVETYEISTGYDNQQEANGITRV